MPQITFGDSENFWGFSICFAYKKASENNTAFFLCVGLSSVTVKFISVLVYLPGDAARAKGRRVLNLLTGKCLKFYQDLCACTLKKLSSAI